MQKEIRIVDEESRFINWKRFDYLLMKLLRSALIVAATMIGWACVYRVLTWWWGV